MLTFVFCWITPEVVGLLPLILQLRVAPPALLCCPVQTRYLLTKKSVVWRLLGIRLRVWVRRLRLVRLVEDLRLREGRRMEDRTRERAAGMEY
jgi:hypothetical protein